MVTNTSSVPSVPTVLWCDFSGQAEPAIVASLIQAEMRVLSANTPETAYGQWCDYDVSIMIFRVHDDLETSLVFVEQLLESADSQATPFLFLFSTPMSQLNQSELDRLMNLRLVDTILVPCPAEVLLNKIALMTELYQLSREVRTFQSQYATMQSSVEQLFHATPSALIGLSHDGVVVDINETALAQLSISKDQIIDKPLTSWCFAPGSNLSDSMAEIRDAGVQNIRKAINDKQTTHPFELLLKMGDGGHIAAIGQCVFVNNSEHPFGFLFSFEENPDRSTVVPGQEVRFDPLTGIASRGLLRHFLIKAMARDSRNQRRFAIAMIGMNQFSKINEELGEFIGDELLKQVARRLRKSIRAGDLVARYDQDVFVVVLDEIQAPKDIEFLISGLLNQIMAPMIVHGWEISVRACAGIGIFPFDGDGVDELLQRAHRDMLKDKKRRRARSQQYEPMMVNLTSQSHKQGDVSGISGEARESIS